MPESCSRTEQHHGPQTPRDTVLSVAPPSGHLPGEFAITSGSFTSSFQIGALPYTLEKITLRARSRTSSASNATIRVYNDSGSGTPNFSSQFETFDTVLLATGAIAEYTFSAATPGFKQMAAGATYWVEVDSVNNTSQGWMLEEGNTNTGIGGMFTLNGLSSDRAAPILGAVGTDLFKRVEGTAIPEPSAFLFIGLVACGGMLVRRRPHASVIQA